MVKNGPPLPIANFGLPGPIFALSLCGDVMRVIDIILSSDDITYTHTHVMTSLCITV